MFKKVMISILVAVLLSLTATAINELTYTTITPVFQIPSTDGSLRSSVINPGDSAYFEASDLSNSHTYGLTFSYSKDPSNSGTRIISYSFIVETDSNSYSDTLYLPYVTGYTNYNTSTQKEIQLIVESGGIYAIRSTDSTFPFQGYITSSAAQNDSGTIFNVQVILICDINTFSDVFLEFDLYSLYKSGVEYEIGPTSPVYVFISDTSTEEFQSTVTDSLGSVNSNLQGVQTGLNNVISSLASGNQSVVTAMEAVKEAIEQFKEDYPEMTQQATESALDSFFNKLKQEAVNAGNETVQAIQEQLNIDISGIQQSTETLYNAVSTHDANPTLQLKAGTVSIAGQTFTFWEAQDINFDEVLNNQWIQLLLIPLRFVLIFGFSKYLLNVVKRIESLVTMNGGD